MLQAWDVRRPQWLMKRCDFCAGYWISVLLLVGGGYWYIQYMLLPMWPLWAVVPLGLPAAAVCRAVAGPL